MTRLVISIVLTVGVLLGVRALAITAGQIDVDNTHENVGATLITVGPGHPAGVPKALSSDSAREPSSIHGWF
jgi:hypothetical protein